MIEDAEFPEGLEVASALLNDSYQSDVCLRHFPYQIALGCVFVSAIILGLKEKLKPWVTSLNVEMERVCPAAALSSLLSLLSLSSLSSLSSSPPSPPSPWTV
jgi:hypothetical protein